MKILVFPVLVLGVGYLLVLLYSDRAVSVFLCLFVCFTMLWVGNSFLFVCLVDCFVGWMAPTLLFVCLTVSLLLANPCLFVCLTVLWAVVKWLFVCLLDCVVGRCQLYIDSTL